MGKKVVNLFICDYCKKDFKEQNTTKLSLKKGKKSAHIYDLCPQCTELLQTILVSNKEPVTKTYNEVLGTDLTGLDMIPSKINYAKQGEQAADENDRLIAVKAANRPSTEQSEVPSNMTEPFSAEANVTDLGTKCTHANKTQPFFKEVNGNTLAYQRCKDCKNEVRCLTKAEKELYWKGK